MAERTPLHCTVADTVRNGAELVWLTCSEERGAKLIVTCFMFREENEVVHDRLNNTETTVLLYSDFMGDTAEAFLIPFEGHSIALVMSHEEFAWTVLAE